MFIALFCFYSLGGLTVYVCLAIKSITSKSTTRFSRTIRYPAILLHRSLILTHQVVPKRPIHQIGIKIKIVLA